MPTTEQKDALAQISEIARAHKLSIKDITDFIVGDKAEPHRRSEILTKLFGYMGGIFVFAGVAIYTGMHWEAMGSAARIVITLGTGIVAYVLALVCLRDERYIRLSTPLFLIAGLFEPGGMLVTITEYSTGGEPRHAFLFVFGIMAIQMGMTFWREQRAVLLFLLITFGATWLSIAFDLLDFDEKWNALVVGFFIMSLTWAISKTRFRSICGFWHFIGGGTFLCALWWILEDAHAEILFIVPACFFIFLSVVARSRALLLIGVLAVLGFISYYTAEYFSNSSAWPLGLLLMGGVLIGMSKFAMNLNRKYIKQVEEN
ncbi:MAG: DUF2157 domain-containing protein [Gammaproteobacteria bacterium]|nr:DUF2157 domain-containing protein [Gammaproteobacteria bacterium]